MIKKCIALSISIILGTGSGVAQITIRIPRVSPPKSRVQITRPVRVTVSPSPIRPTVYRARPKATLAPPNEASGYSRTTATINDNKKKMLAEWKEKADKGDVLAAYQIGRAFETGNTAYPVESPNLAQAVTWYNRAVSGGNLNATYHLGVLIASKKVLVTDSTGGTMHADMLSGRKMMDYAVQHGYDPVSDSARLPSAGSEDSTAAMVVGVAAALVLFGALASSNNSDSGGNSTAGTGTGLTQCKIPQFNAVSAETTYVPAFGDACTAWGARPY